MEEFDITRKHLYTHFYVWSNKQTVIKVKLLKTKIKIKTLNSVIINLVEHMYTWTDIFYEIIQLMASLLLIKTP